MYSCLSFNDRKEFTNILILPDQRVLNDKQSSQTTSFFLSTEYRMIHRVHKHLNSSRPWSFEWFIENQAYLRSSDSTPRVAPPPPLPSASWLSFSGFLSSSLLTGVGRGVGCGRGAKSYDSEKAWSYINHSILSVPDPSLLKGTVQRDRSGRN